MTERRFGDSVRPGPGQGWARVIWRERRGESGAWEWVRVAPSLGRFGHCRGNIQTKPSCHNQLSRHILATQPSAHHQ